MNEHYEIEARKYGDTFVAQRVDMSVSTSPTVKFDTLAEAQRAIGVLVASGYIVRVVKVTREVELVFGVAA